VECIYCIDFFRGLHTQSSVVQSNPAASEAKWGTHFSFIPVCYSGLFRG